MDFKLNIFIKWKKRILVSDKLCFCFKCSIKLAWALNSKEKLTCSFECHTQVHDYVLLTSCHILTSSYVLLTDLSGLPFASVHQLSPVMKMVTNWELSIMTAGSFQIFRLLWLSRVKNHVCRQKHHEHPKSNKVLWPNSFKHWKMCDFLFGIRRLWKKGLWIPALNYKLNFLGTSFVKVEIGRKLWNTCSLNLWRLFIRFQVHKK